MLASGNHVKIGTKEFRLAFDNESAYSYFLMPTGEDTQFWLFDDWCGGEGNDAFDPTDPTVYDQGNTNPRIPGFLTSPPTRATANTGTDLSPVPDVALTAIAGGRLYFFGETVTTDANSAWFTTNTTTFTELALTWNSGNLIDRITAVCSDGMNIYVSAQDNATGGYQIIRIGGASGTQTTIRNYGVPTSTYPILGMGVLGNYLYYYNGHKFKYRKIDGAAGANDRTVITGPDLAGLTWKTDYWGGAVNGDGSVFYFLSTEGRTTVYETSGTDSATTEIWTLPNGFTGKAITFQSGAVIIVGEYQNNAAAYGMSKISRQPIFLGFVRLGTDISLEVAGAGFGTEVIMAERDISSGGKVFVYDVGYDAFSELDEITLAAGEIHSAGTFLDKRFVAAENGGKLYIYTWEADDTPSTTVDGRMESGVWDMDLPEDQKQLDGFHVLSDANSTKQVKVYYQDDEDGVWTLAGTATTGFHNYLQVSSASSTATFRTLRVRVDCIAGAKCYGVSTRFRVNTYEEEWQMLLDLTDDKVDNASAGRSRTNPDRGWQLRDYIRDISDNKAVVTFLDGAKYPQGDGDDPDKYSTHTVIVDIPVDRLMKPGEGPMLVRLKSVAVN